MRSRKRAVTLIRTGLAIVVVIPLLAYSGFAGWNTVRSGTLAWLRSVHFSDKNTGRIVGSQGTILTTTNGGRTWEESPKFTDGTILDVFFRDADNGILLCERDRFARGDLPMSYLAATSDGGKTWTNIETGAGSVRFSRMFFDEHSTNGYVIGEGGWALKIRFGHEGVEPLDLPSRYLLLGGTFIDTSSAFITGGGGTILKGTNGGSNWSEIPAGSGSVRLGAIAFADKDKGCAVGDEGRILCTSDGGNIWRDVRSGVEHDLLDIAFAGSNFGIAVGDAGSVLITTSAGEKWTEEPSGTKGRIERIVYAGGKWFAVGFGGVILVREQEGTVPVLRKKENNV